MRQALILAAGKSTRVYPLTLTRPKPLLKVANKTLLERNLDNLDGLVGEVIIIVGYKKEMIQDYIGDKYKSLKISYLYQDEQLGTGHAVSIAEPFITGKFLIIMGDDLYSKNDIINCSKKENSILVFKVKNPENFGVVVEEKGILKDFAEKPKKFVSNLANTACYCLDKRIFNHLKCAKKSERGEIELPAAINLLGKETEVHCIRAKDWNPIGYPLDLLAVDKKLRHNKNNIGSGSEITGVVKNSSIGINCKIYGNVEGSIIMDNSVILEGSSVKNSVIGEGCTFSGKILSGNSISIVNEKSIHLNDFGAFLGDGVRAEGVVVNPGSKVWPHNIIKNRTISGDVK